MALPILFAETGRYPLPHTAEEILRDMKEYRAILELNRQAIRFWNRVFGWGCAFFILVLISLSIVGDMMKTAVGPFALLATVGVILVILLIFAGLRKHKLGKYPNSPNTAAHLEQIVQNLGCDIRTKRGFRGEVFFGNYEKPEFQTRTEKKTPWEFKFYVCPILKVEVVLVDRSVLRIQLVKHVRRKEKKNATNKLKVKAKITTHLHLTMIPAKAKNLEHFSANLKVRRGKPGLALKKAQTTGKRVQAVYHSQTGEQVTKSNVVLFSDAEKADFEPKHLLAEVMRVCRVVRTGQPV